MQTGNLQLENAGTPPRYWVQAIYDILSDTDPRPFAWVCLGDGSSDPSDDSPCTPSPGMAFEALDSSGILAMPGDIYIRVTGPDGMLEVAEQLAPHHLCGRVIVEVSCAERPTRHGLSMLDSARQQGLRLALAPCASGSQYRLLRTIAPDYVRVNVSPLDGTPSDRPTLPALAAFNDLAWRVGAMPIWDGLSAPEDIAIARRAGVWYARGPVLSPAVSVEQARLSMSPEEEGARLDSAPAVSPATLARKTILVVDDSPTALMVEALALRDTPYRVVTAKSGEEGLSKVVSECPDLMLLDVVMPEIDGFEVCRRLRAQHVTRNLPVIMVTTRGEVENREAGFSSGCTDYVTKPLDRVELLLKIRNFLGE